MLVEVAENFIGGNIKVQVFLMISVYTVSFMVLALNQSRKAICFFPQGKLSFLLSLQRTRTNFPIFTPWLALFKTLVAKEQQDSYHWERLSLDFNAFWTP